MKRKIVTIIALLAVMVALTGVASAFDVQFLLPDGTKSNPVFIKNGESFNLQMRLENLRTQDNLITSEISTQYFACADNNNVPNNNCGAENLTLELLKTNIIAQYPDVTQPDTLRVSMHAGPNTKVGTQWSFIVTTGPFGDPPETAVASLTIKLAGVNITGMKCEDKDVPSTGTCHEGQTPLKDWTIVLTMPDGTTVSTMTDANGKYKFTNLTPGTYEVSEILQTGWEQTGPNPSVPIPPGASVNPDKTWSVTIAQSDVNGLNFANTPVVEECPGGKCKVVGWGTLGPKATPELTFKIFAFTSFMPKGTVEAEDDAGNKIKATEINSVITKKNVDPMTGEIKGKAMFNNEGPYDFVVKVEDGGQPTYAPYVGKDTFDISISAKNYHKSGTLTSGDLQVIY